AAVDEQTPAHADGGKDDGDGGAGEGVLRLETRADVFDRGDGRVQRVVGRALDEDDRVTRLHAGGPERDRAHAPQRHVLVQLAPGDELPHQLRQRARVEQRGDAIRAHLAQKPAGDGGQVAPAELE